jgi:hypothetical protein
MRVGRGVAHETQLLALDVRLEVDLRHARDLAAQAHFGKLGHGANARTPRAQRRRDAGAVVAYARDDAGAGDDYALLAAHAIPP